MLRSALIALALTTAGAAALADDGDRYRDHDRGQYYRQNDRHNDRYDRYDRRNEYRYRDDWRRHRHRHYAPPRVYYPAPRYYAPPRVYYPPPRYYPAPGYYDGGQPSLGIQLYIPLR